MADCRRGELRRLRVRADCQRMAGRDFGGMQAARVLAGAELG